MTVAPGMVRDHLCRNTACVNPAHLEIVTSRENTLGGIGIDAKKIVDQVAPLPKPEPAKKTAKAKKKARAR